MMDLALEVSPPALAEITKVGFDPVFGARVAQAGAPAPHREPAVELLLDGSFVPKDTIAVTTDPIRAPGKFIFSTNEQLAVHAA
jgi:ATP-dependent Clp protease ATP-binding subunit ClpB